VTESKRPLDQALDLFVYAPLGLALTARDELPRLAEMGRQRVDAQLTMARMVGQFAVGEAGRRLEKLTAPRSGPPSPAPAPPSADQKPAPAPRTTRLMPTGNGNGPVPSGDGLAIHGYDALAASQVVQRLAGLSSEELEAVRAYEAATRHRKTILNRVEQLQADNNRA
jgi:hypothetical protein